MWEATTPRPADTAAPTPAEPSRQRVLRPRRLVALLVIAAAIAAALAATSGRGEPEAGHYGFVSLHHVFTQLPLAITAAGLGAVVYTVLAASAL